LTGKYIFGDLATGALFYADANSLEAGTKIPIYRPRIFYHGAEAATTAGAVLKSGRADLRLGLGEDGEIYVLTKADGAIRQIVHHALIHCRRTGCECLRSDGRIEGLTHGTAKRGDDSRSSRTYKRRQWQLGAPEVVLLSEIYRAIGEAAFR
jgi:hypothetical protein